MSLLPVPQPPVTVVPDAQVRERAGILAFLSSQARTGRWDLPQHLRVLGLFGSVEVDLRQARFPAGGVTLEVVAIFGSVEIILPSGVHADVDGDATLGEFSLTPDPGGPAGPDAPRVRITGHAILSSVEVQYWLAGEDEWAAKARMHPGLGKFLTRGKDRG